MNHLRSFVLACGILLLLAAKLPAQDSQPGHQEMLPAPHLSEADAAASAQDKAPTFQLTLKPGLRDREATEFRAGSPVWMTVVIRNLTNHAIDMSGARSGSLLLEFDYEVRNEDGRLVERIDRKHPELDVRAPYWSIVPPGESEFHEIQLERICKLDRPGKYVVRVFRKEPVLKDAAGSSVVEKSNAVVITITG